MSTPSVKRPANLEQVAFWSVTHLAQLIKTKQVTSTELTQMYLSRLHKYNAKLNCAVTILDEMGLAQAKKADAETLPGTKGLCIDSVGAKDISRPGIQDHLGVGRI
jgi:Asp-tRNA(Asn)/Glu-tRNA(Gln) amidotransferase A subunit family amidase